MVNRILAVVVTYFPEKELLKKNISAYIDDVDNILIWENTPNDKKQQFRYIKNEKIKYCGDGINSISHALNYAWRYAQTNGYDYLLTMDQDSVFEDFQSYLNMTVNSVNTPEGIWGPTIVSGKGMGRKDTDEDYVEIKSPLGLMTSGLLLSVPLISLIGGWNEFFKIDCIDHEFCFRAKRKSVHMYIFNTILNHNLGYPHEVHFMGHHNRLLNYSAQRYYSIYRSYMCLIRLYPDEKYLKEFYKCYWLGSIKWIFFFERHRFQKLYFIFKGVLSGYFTVINKVSYISNEQSIC